MGFKGVNIICFRDVHYLSCSSISVGEFAVLAYGCGVETLSGPSIRMGSEHCHVMYGVEWSLIADVLKE